MRRARPSRAAWLALWLFAASACDENPAVDAGAVDGGLDAGLESTEPQAPRLSPCPEGWAERALAGAAVCEPTPGGVVECEPGQARFVGSAACADVGRACPAGDFADDLPTEGVLYVRPGASGSGTREQPFGTLAEALAAAPVGGTVALARGNYDEHLALRNGVLVRGACAASTRLAWTVAGGQFGAVHAVDGALEDVTIGATDNIGVFVGGEGARLRGVVVEGAQLFGLAALGGAITLERVVIRDTRRAPDGSQGLGLVAVDGAQVMATDLLLERNHQVGLAVGGEGSRVQASRLAVRDGAVGAVPRVAAGLLAEAGGQLEVDQAEVSRAIGAGVIVTAGGRVELTSAVIREVRGLEEDQGFGVAATGGAFVARGLLVEDTEGAAVSGIGAVELTLEDTVIDAPVDHDARAGWAAGVSVANGASLTLRRSIIQRVAGAALSAVGRAGAARGELSVRLEDLVVRDVEDRGVGGIGVYLAGGVEAAATRVSVERATLAAWIVSNDSHLALTHGSVLDTREGGADGLWGRGLEAVGGSDVELTDVRFERQREVALIFRQSRGVLREVEVRETLERACAADACGEAPGGIGLSVYAGGVVDARGFEIVDAPLCGVQIAEGGEFDLADGRIASSSTGACVQVDDYDLARLTGDVVYEDNATNIATTTHHLPDPSPPL